MTMVPFAGSGGLRAIAGMALLAGAALLPARLGAQQGVAADPILAAIDSVAIEDSRVEELAQALTDSIGPRLTGTPGMQAANEWVAERYREWGIGVRIEPYGTWPGWRRGVTHVDLLEPRVKTLRAMLHPWSAPTSGPRTAKVVQFPEVARKAELEAWLAGVRGRAVLLDAAPVTCRPAESWERWGGEEASARVEDAAAEAEARWEARLASAGVDLPRLISMLAEAGATAVLTTDWTGGWGATRLHGMGSDLIPMINLSCEDYGLLFRLAERGQGPVIRIEAEAEFLGPVQVANTIATIPGTELPDEYVILSAHLDSWDGASGATDNGTGTVVMMEAMRILKEVYPHPRRTIIAGHWSGEEQGIHGSAAFAADHPEIVAGIQVALNQDNGTGRIERIFMEGFAEVAPVFEQWLAQMPDDLAEGIELISPGTPSGGTSDHSSFICRGAPAFFLRSGDWDYGTYTWHTDLDTFDKIALDEVRRNARFVAMLAYLASEHPEKLSRARAVEEWPECRVPQR